MSRSSPSRADLDPPRITPHLRSSDGRFEGRNDSKLAFFPNSSSYDRPPGANGSISSRVRSESSLTEARFARLESALMRGPAAHGWLDQRWLEEDPVPPAPDRRLPGRVRCRALARSGRPG